MICIGQVLVILNYDKSCMRVLGAILKAALRIVKAKRVLEEMTIVNLSGTLYAGRILLVGGV